MNSFIIFWIKSLFWPLFTSGIGFSFCFDFTNYVRNDYYID
jgi:hypothetical protein